MNGYVVTQVEELIEEANEQWDRAEGRKQDDERMLPLIRLRVSPR